MAVSATQLRQNIYAILDEALKTGKPVEIERKGKVLRIVPEIAPNREMIDENDLSEFPRLARLTKKDWFVGNPEDIVHMDWSHEWSELKKLKKKRARK
jgi:antitoxin (DNA-binding transcriptional repressor) of toxin-antitoxin stability system